MAYCYPVTSAPGAHIYHSDRCSMAETICQLRAERTYILNRLAAAETNPTHCNEVQGGESSKQGTGGSKNDNASSSRNARQTTLDCKTPSLSGPNSKNDEETTALLQAEITKRNRMMANLKEAVRTMEHELAQICFHLDDVSFLKTQEDDKDDDHTVSSPLHQNQIETGNSLQPSNDTLDILRNQVRLRNEEIALLVQLHDRTERQLIQGYAAMEKLNPNTAAERRPVRPEWEEK
ncbi:hypothetical protein QBC35DRAFT_479191 [Podospora australis]|uniref:Uncharacterized protein n=1 Tax=Podospora australis TaxID=1536484 RepID=A0AAN7AD97_9PEZI|nr:hypothetical protein QBC35DRAFT_479191 [Podospora australis]